MFNCWLRKGRPTQASIPPYAVDTQRGRPCGRVGLLRCDACPMSGPWACPHQANAATVVKGRTVVAVWQSITSACSASGCGRRFVGEAGTRRLTGGLSGDLLTSRLCCVGRGLAVVRIYPRPSSKAPVLLQGTRRTPTRRTADCAGVASSALARAPAHSESLFLTLTSVVLIAVHCVVRTQGGRRRARWTAWHGCTAGQSAGRQRASADAG